jgi:hypothetical protein
MSEERRESPRFVVELGVDIEAQGQRFTASTKDVSVSGCCIVAPYPLIEESTVGCSLYVVVDGVEEEGIAGLSTQALVQWAADTGESGSDERHMAGLKFQGLGEPQMEWLQGIISKAQD